MDSNKNRQSGAGLGADDRLSPPASTPPLLLKVREVARLLQLSRSAVYTLMERGELPYVKIGASRRVERAAVHKLIEAGRVGT